MTAGRPDENVESQTSDGHQRARNAVPEGLEDLPITAHRKEILETIGRSPVTCIQGDTGCGKSTRLPVFLYQEWRANVEAWKRNNRKGLEPKLRMVITQPRRIACTSLAKRVSEELGQPVGYRIGGERDSSGPTNVTFVTTGYLKELLVYQPEHIDRYTHVILDEVHERDLDADLLSLLIKMHMRRADLREGEVPQFKLVIMSATLQGDLFSQYFAQIGSSGIPKTIHVGVKRFPVETLFLEDIRKSLFKPGLKFKNRSPANRNDNNALEARVE
eukprot:Selendium_serpulae@DN9128_c0_g1_i1.p1